MSIEPTSTPMIRILSRRDFLTLTGTCCVTVSMGFKEDAHATLPSAADQSGTIRMKMPELPCCSPVYRAMKTRDGGFVVWATLPETGRQLRAYGLNASGGFVLRMCDGTRSLKEIGVACQGTGLSGAQTEVFVHRLEELGVVVVGGYASFLAGYPGAKDGMTYYPRFE